MKVFLIILLVLIGCKASPEYEDNTVTGSQELPSACKYQWYEYDQTWGCEHLLRIECQQEYGDCRPTLFYENSTCQEIGCTVSVENNLYSCD